MRNTGGWKSAGAAIIGLSIAAMAHPGGSIAVDEQGVVYFADTGRGVWTARPGRELALLSEVRQCYRPRG
jgi:hypothetical protein